ncbi:MAG: TonB-dependent receptor, partial [Bacteroidia bacterium]|nr:TonB-dependent receptor [Bacteroidia bacterium]
YLYARDDNGLPFSPAWWTLNLKAGMAFSKSLSLNLGLENILNKRYRPYSSGITAAGRNLIISLYGRF